MTHEAETTHDPLAVRRADLTAAFERRAQDLQALTAAALAQVQSDPDPATIRCQCDQVAAQVHKLQAIAHTLGDVSLSREVFEANRARFFRNVTDRGAHLMMLTQILINYVSDQGDLEEVEAMTTAVAEAAQNLKAMVSERHATYKARVDAEDEARDARRAATGNRKTGLRAVQARRKAG